VVYYIVFPTPRYRVPIEPEIAILCVFLVTEAGTNTKVSALPTQSSAHESG
jgi:hypothetical protein